MSPLLKAYEKDCQASRMAAPDLPACLNQAYRQLGCDPDPVFVEVNQKIIGLLEADAKDAEHAYHNRHHVGDVIAAVVLLISQTDIAPDARTSLAHSMITAALGHDVHHDGFGTSSDLDLERKSATAVLAIGRDAGISRANLAFIEGLILATYPPVQLDLRQKLASGEKPDRKDLFALMFGEADVLASLTPTFGKALSVTLSEEWRKAGRSFPSMPDDDAGRTLFLGCYRLVTPSAQRLGVDVMVSEQLRILERKAL